MPLRWLSGLVSEIEGRLVALIGVDRFRALHADLEKILSEVREFK